jgi:methionyl-tRNA formyltransferase
MLLREAVPIRADDTTARLHDRLATLGGRLIVEALEIAACGGLRAEPQPAEGITYAHKIEKAESAIDWSLPAAVIERRVRAFDPFPGASSALAGEAIKVWSAQVVEGGGAPGSVLDVDDQGITVACGQQALRLTQLQRAGGKRLAAAEFLRGFPVQRGQRLGDAA